MTRTQEKFLINLGLETLLERMIPVNPRKKKVTKKPKSGWSDERRAKFQQTMHKKYKTNRQKK